MWRKKISFLLFATFMMVNFICEAQNTDSTFNKKMAFKSATLSIKDPVSNIKFGGYFRFFEAKLLNNCYRFVELQFFLGHKDQNIFLVQQREYEV